MSQPNTIREQSPNLGTRLNNPGNIRSGPIPIWLGQTGTEKGFARFSEPVYGVRAGLKLLVNYNLKGYNTLRKILDRYAPDHTGINYLQYLSEKTGFGPDEVFPPTPENFKKIFRYMMIIEVSGLDATTHFIPELDRAWNMIDDTKINPIAIFPVLNYVLSGGILAGLIFVLYSLILKLKNK